MRIFKVNPENLRESKEAVEEAVRVVSKGGVIIYPTDTVYGIGCDATNEEAVKRVFRIKKRHEDKAVPLLVSDLEMAKKSAYFNEKVEKMLLSVWPGPITVLLSKKHSLPRIVTGNKPTVALRIPDYKITHYMVVLCGVPLVATSANISGEPSSNRIEEVIEQFRKSDLRPDLVLNAGDLKFSEPSTILDLSKGKPIITRVGLVNKKKLFDIIGV
jgi:L-threonylcarbamoyladenylate synthase